MRALLIAALLLLACALRMSAAEARPGAGPSFLEPESSADARSRAGKSKIPPKPSIRGAGATAQGERSNSWSYRPGYASPWSEPSAKTPTPTRPGAPAPLVTGAGQGSFSSFYFWILIGVAVVVLVSWALRALRNRDDDAWTSGATSGLKPDTEGKSDP